MGDGVTTDFGDRYVVLGVRYRSDHAETTLTPDEARLIGLKLIRLADKAEEDE